MWGELWLKAGRPRSWIPCATDRSVFVDGELAGRTVVVTRFEEEDATLSEAFRSFGATVVHVPTVEIGPPEVDDDLEAALDRLPAYDWIVLTSRNAVRALSDRGVELPSEMRVAVVGPSTAAHALAAGYDVDMVGSGTGAEALAVAMAEKGIGEGSTVFFPTSDRGRPELEVVLAEAGARVDRVVAYESRIRTFDPTLVPELATADFVTFTSPSAAEGRGLVVVRARETSFDGIVDAVRELARSTTP